MGQGSPQVFPSPTAAKMKAAHAPKASSQPVGFASLPTAAQSAISAAIGRDQSDYHARPTGNGGFRMLNSGGGLAAEFARSGVVVRAGARGGAGWGLTLEEYGRGKSMNLVSSAVPQANANRVEYRRGGLTEWYVNSPLGIEQGFTLARSPARAGRLADQPLTIALGLSGDLTASLDSASAGLTLKQRDGEAVLRYTGLTAQDAAGKLLRCWLELHGNQLLLRINDAGTRYPIMVDPWVQAAQLTNSSGAAGDALGYSVAIDETGDTVVVSSASANPAQGAVYVFVELASGWATTTTFTAELTSSDGAAGDAFGRSVGINQSGNTVVVGAPEASIGSHLEQGAAYVFVEPTNGWASEPTPFGTQTAKLTASDAAAADLFGWSVGIDETGNTVVVGDFYAKIGLNTNQGAAYVFIKPTNGWASEPTPYGTQTAKLTASDGAENDAFGVSVDISGNTVVAGAIQATRSTLRQGVVYVFVEPTNGWASEPTPYGTQTAELTASGGTANSYLGWSVGISGNTVVAGAYQTTIGSTLGQGAAYVFVEPTNGWASEPTTPPFGTQTAELTASDGAANDEFGTSLGISGNTVVVGIGSTTHRGAAYVFVEPTAAGGWASAPSENETAELTASGGAAVNYFGYSVGIGGNTVVVGALATTIGSHTNQGAAYVFTQATLATYSPTQVDFGNVAENVPTTQTVTVTNTGNETLIIQTVLPPIGTDFSAPQYTCSQGGSVSSPCAVGRIVDILDRADA
jgi:hypothetical protein